MNTSDVVRVLTGVPEVRLRLIDLARQVAREDGSLDDERAAFFRKELEEAISEAQAYAQATKEAVRCLSEMARS